VLLLRGLPEFIMLVGGAAVIWRGAAGGEAAVHVFTRTRRLRGDPNIQGIELRPVDGEK
jgi:hypothetical protein